MVLQEAYTADQTFEKPVWNTKEPADPSHGWHTTACRKSPRVPNSTCRQNGTRVCLASNFFWPLRHMRSSKDDLKSDDAEDDAEPTDPESSSSELEIPSLEGLDSSSEGAPAIPVGGGMAAAPAAVVEVPSAAEATMLPATGPSQGEIVATSAEIRFTKEDRTTPSCARMEDSQFPIGYDPVTNPSLSHPELGGGEDMEISWGLTINANSIVEFWAVFSEWVGRSLGGVERKVLMLKDRLKSKSRSAVPPPSVDTMATVPMADNDAEVFWLYMGELGYNWEISKSFAWGSCQPFGQNWGWCNMACTTIFLWLFSPILKAL